MKLADTKFVALLRGKVDRPICGFFGGVELPIRVQQPGKDIQTVHLLRCVAEPFDNFQCFLHLLYRSLVEGQQPVRTRVPPKYAGNLNVIPLPSPQH